MSAGDQIMHGECVANIPVHLQQFHQDWICLKCNNLNFSFRKKCNRCKLQSREENQIAFADYYYYQHYYQCQQLPQKHTETHNYNTNHINNQNKFVSPKKTISFAHAKEKENDDCLPSVSPLLKKCQKLRRKQHGKTPVLPGVWNIFGQQLWAYQDISLENRYVDFANIDDEQSNEIIRSIQKMIL